jgi:threonine/homoserine/homoserine lactone efflux protein
MHWGAFLAASFLLAITPGSGVTYIVTRTLERGRAAGLASVLGVALGNLANGIGAAAGLALLFEHVPAAYTFVKIAGAGYLAFLGVRALRAEATKDETKSASRPATIVRDGFLVALLNPKTALFFAAFLPQFVGATPSVPLAITLASSFVAIAACTDAGYAVFAGSIAPLLETPRARGVLRWGPALVYFALALFAALA